MASIFGGYAKPARNSGGEQQQPGDIFPHPPAKNAKHCRHSPYKPTPGAALFPIYHGITSIIALKSHTQTPKKATKTAAPTARQKTARVS
jgi:hypothetical protein